MGLKIIIVILFIGNIVALASAFSSLLADPGKASRRTANRLFIRVALAVSLIVVVTYGIWSGELAISAPWY